MSHAPSTTMRAQLAYLGTSVVVQGRADLGNSVLRKMGNHEVSGGQFGGIGASSQTHPTPPPGYVSELPSAVLVIDVLVHKRAQSHLLVVRLSNPVIRVLVVHVCVDLRVRAQVPGPRNLTERQWCAASPSTITVWSP